MHWVRYMKSSASESKPFQSRSKGEIPGRARRKERLSRSKLKQAFLIDSAAKRFILIQCIRFGSRKVRRLNRALLFLIVVIVVDQTQLELLSYFSRDKEKGVQNMFKLAKIEYRISSKKRPDAYFKFQLEGSALIRLRALIRGAAY